MTLGLVSALPEAKAVLSSYSWELLREAREVACREGLLGKVGDQEDELGLIALRMWALARQGLIRRGLGEEKFLDPLERRLHASTCPADRAENLFESGGIDALLDKWRF